MTTAAYPMPILKSGRPENGQNRETSKSDDWRKLVARYDSTLASLKFCQTDFLRDRHGQHSNDLREREGHVSAPDPYDAEIAHRQAARAILNFKAPETMTFDWLLKVIEIAEQYMPPDCRQARSPACKQLALASGFTKILAWLDIGACFDFHGTFPEGYEVELVDAVERIESLLASPELGPLRRTALQSLRRHYLSELRVEFGAAADTTSEHNSQREKRERFVNLYGEKYLYR